MQRKTIHYIESADNNNTSIRLPWLMSLFIQSKIITANTANKKDIDWNSQNLTNSYDNLKQITEIRIITTQAKIVKNEPTVLEFAPLFDSVYE